MNSDVKVKWTMLEWYIYKEFSFQETKCKWLKKTVVLKWLFTSISEHIKMFVNFELVKQYKNTYLQNFITVQSEGNKEKKKKSFQLKIREEPENNCG